MILINVSGKNKDTKTDHHIQSQVFYSNIFNFYQYSNGKENHKIANHQKLYKSFKRDKKNLNLNWAFQFACFSFFAVDIFFCYVFFLSLSLIILRLNVLLILCTPMILLFQMVKYCAFFVRSMVSLSVCLSAVCVLSIGLRGELTESTWMNGRLVFCIYEWCNCANVRVYMCDI